MKPGEIILFVQKKKPMLGLCLSDTPKHVRVLAENNKEINVVNDKILATLKHPLPSGLNRLNKVMALQELVPQNTDDIDLKMLWEFLDGEDSPQDLVFLTDMYFSDTTDQHLLLLAYALAEDPLYFTLKNQGFVRCGADEIAKSKEILERAALKQAQEDAFQAWFKLALSGEAPPLEEPLHAFLNPIKDVALHGQKSSKYSKVSQLFESHGAKGHLESKCLKVMIISGIWDEDENLHLIEQNVPRHFSEELLNHTQTLALNIEVELAERTDLRHLHTVTIDEAHTQDIDDALSWQFEEDKTTLWIHIADPASFIEIDSPLDKEAILRFTSIYLCQGKIEMLPKPLSQDLCSLVQGQDRLALSVKIEMTRDYKILNTRIMESVIHVDQRLTYDQANELIETKADYQTLFDLVQHFQSQRIEKGAVTFQKPELQIKVTPDKEIILKRTERDVPSQHLVSELMILTNSLVAQIMSEASVPLIYKVQEAPKEFFPDGKPMLKRSILSTKSGEHYGLGLAAYTQFTSPIRRYNDLLLHRQIKAWLRSRPLAYDTSALEKMIALSDQSLFSANFIQREDHRYWLLKYIKGLPKPRVFQAEMAYIKEDKRSIYIPEFCYSVPFSKSEAVGLQVGDTLMIEILGVHPRHGSMNIRRRKDLENPEIESA